MSFQERIEEEFSLGTLFWGGYAESFFGPSQDEKDELLKKAELSDETEKKYLLLSWWLMHVSWQQVAEKVRVAVEERVAGFVERIYSLTDEGY
jgi:peroxin-3